MAAILKSIRGRFILSLSAVQGVFETFRAFATEVMDSTNLVSGGASKKVRKLITSG